MKSSRPIWKRTLRIAARALLGFVLFVALYFSAAFLLSRMGVKEEKGQPDELSIFIKTNGAHTDLVMPVRHPLRDWDSLLPAANTRGRDTTGQYIGVGWGDKGFYLETPTWADLTASTAIKACFWLSSSAVHATYYPAIATGEDCREIRISNAQYARLLAYVDNTFEPGAAGRPQAIETDAVYGQADAFYEARGRYSFLKTCNVWTNNGLKACGQKAAVWAPFDWGIFYQYR